MDMRRRLILFNRSLNFGEELKVTLKLNMRQNLNNSHPLFEEAFPGRFLAAAIGPECKLFAPIQVKSK